MGGGWGIVFHSCPTQPCCVRYQPPGYGGAPDLAYLEALILRFRFSPFPFLNLINSGVFSVFVLHCVFH